VGWPTGGRESVCAFTSDCIVFKNPSQ